MANLRYRFILHFASFLFLIGLFVSISPVLAESVNVPSSNELSPCEQGKETIIKAKEIIEALDKEGGELDYGDCIVVGDLDFFILSKEKDTETGEYFINITRPLKFSKTVFKGRISTVNRSIQIWDEPRVNFSSKIDFTAASFEDVVIFDNAVFEENVRFERAHFHKWVSFKKSTFKKIAHFHSAQFDNVARFDNIRFENDANFAYTTFNSLAFFHRAKFLLPESKWGANFLFTRFNKDSIFSNTHFASNANFISTQFHGRTYFSNSTFDDQAYFSGVLFDNDVTFKDAKFLKNSSISRKEGGAPREPVFFGGVIFSGNAVFSNVIFGRVAFCDVGTEVDTGINTIFQKKAYFRDATFGTLNLRGTIFQSTVDFSGAVFRGWVDFTNVDIERASINLKWNQLLDEHKKCFFFNEVKFYSDDSFLSTLEKKFEENMQLNDAGKVRYLQADRTYQELAHLPIIYKLF